MKFIKRQLTKCAEAVKRFMTKRRYAGSKPRVKNAILIGFLLIVNSYVYFHVVAEYAKSPLINISLAKTIVVENPRLATGIKIEAAQPKEAQKIAKIADGSTVEALVKKFFPNNEIAIALAQAESGMNPRQHSTTDKMKDGRAFSIGIMQVNLTWHTIAGVDCSKAFSGKDYEAVVIDENLYNKCVKLAENPELNLETAKGIYERSGNNFGKWGAYTNGSYLKHIK